jgi:hypothetical protein
MTAQTWRLTTEIQICHMKLKMTKEEVLVAMKIEENAGAESLL